MNQILKNSKSLEVRKAVIYSFSNVVKDGTDLKILSDLLKTETDPDLRKTVVYQLGNIESKEAVALLVKVVNEDKSLESCSIGSRKYRLPRSSGSTIENT